MPRRRSSFVMPAPRHWRWAWPSWKSSLRPGLQSERFQLFLQAQPLLFELCMFFAEFAVLFKHLQAFVAALIRIKIRIRDQCIERLQTLTGALHLGFHLLELGIKGFAQAGHALLLLSFLAALRLAVGTGRFTTAGRRGAVAGFSPRIGVASREPVAVVF